MKDKSDHLCGWKLWKNITNLFSVTWLFCVNAFTQWSNVEVNQEKDFHAFQYQQLESKSICFDFKKCPEWLV